MKLNEFMIDDWVSYKDKPYQVNGIEDNHLYLREKNGLPFMVLPEDVFPIFITKEIMAKNGAEDTYCSFHLQEDEHLFMELTWIDEGLFWTTNLCEYDIIPLEYVHELQHAIKLCRIKKEIIL